jgi:hypothetical protein
MWTGRAKLIRGVLPHQAHLNQRLRGFTGVGGTERLKGSQNEGWSSFLFKLEGRKVGMLIASTDEQLQSNSDQNKTMFIRLCPLEDHKQCFHQAMFILSCNR